MAIALVRDASGGRADNGLTITATLGGTPSNDNLLVGVGTRRQIAAATETMSLAGTGGSFTSVVKADGFTGRGAAAEGVEIFYRVASSEGTVYTLTMTGTGTSEECCLWVGEYSGCKTTDVVGDTASHNGAADDAQTSTTSISVDTTGTLSLLVFGMAQSNNTTGSQTGLSYTNSFGQPTNGFSDPWANSGDCNVCVATRIVTSAANYSTVASWSSACHACNVLAEFYGISSTPPTNTVPTSSGQCFQLDTSTAITSGDEPTVAAGSSAITSVTLAATAGLALILDNTGTSVTFTGNGTNNVVLENGASATEYNTVLATISYSASTRGKKTITMTTTDGTLSDEDSWYVLAAVRGISIAGTHAQIKACYESLNSSGYGMILDAERTSGSVTVYAEDDTSPTPLTDEQTVTLATLPSYRRSNAAIIMNRRRRIRDMRFL